MCCPSSGLAGARFTFPLRSRWGLTWQKLDRSTKARSTPLRTWEPCCRSWTRPPSSQSPSFVLVLWLMLLSPLRDHALDRFEVLDRSGGLARRTLALCVSEPRQQQVEVIALVQAHLRLALSLRSEPGRQPLASLDAGHVQRGNLFGFRGVVRWCGRNREHGSGERQSGDERIALSSVQLLAPEPYACGQDPQRSSNETGTVWGWRSTRTRSTTRCWRSSF